MLKCKHWGGMGLLFAIVILILLAFVSPSVFSYGNDQDFMVQGRVIAVAEGESTVGSFGEMENQLVTIRLLEGQYRDQEVTIMNLITGQPYYDIVVNTGDRVLIQVEQDGESTSYNLVDFARDRTIGVLFALFVITLLVIGGVKGLKALISIIMMGLAIGYVLLPLLLRGYSPIPVTVSIASLVTIAFLLFIGGVNRKTVAAIGGTVGGLFVAGVLSYWIGRATYLTGLSSSEAQMLQFMEGRIDFQGLLFSGIIIGALGAILDVGMSVSSSMEQIWETNPTLELNALISRGLKVGRDMLGTMSNTLILAYLGTSMPLLLLFQAYDMSWYKVINLDLIATELVRAMAGSIGLAFAIPLTACLAGLLFSQVQPVSEE